MIMRLSLPLISFLSRAADRLLFSDWQKTVGRRAVGRLARNQPVSDAALQPAPRSTSSS